MIPAVCFVIPAPDEDAQRCVSELRAQLDSLRRTWTERQRALRFRMIFSTIGVVRSWDMQQVTLYPSLLLFSISPCRLLSLLFSSITHVYT